MSNIDKRALREAAEKATPGVWVYLPKNTSIEYDYGSDDSQGSVTYMDSGDFTQKQTDLNGSFIAAANPATVLALLDELEASQSENERLAKTLIERNGEPVEGLVKRVAELEEIATDYGMKFQRAQDALKQQSLLHKSQLEAAEKRIAELSASHGNLREAMAGIHNTITAGGAYTPLAEILNASKRAYEESAAAAAKGE